MKQIILTLAIAFVAFVVNAQSQPKKEGAHQAEYNAKQHEVDGENGPSKRLPDARDVSAGNEMQTDSIAHTTEENTMAPASDSQAALDGTGNMPEATLNVAGSPIPGTSKKVVEKNSTSKVKEKSPATTQSAAPEKQTVKSKKKKKR